MKEINTFIDQHQDDLIELVRTLVRFPTVSPPARNTAVAQQFVASYLQELGYATDMWDVYPGDPNVVGVKKGDSAYRSILLNGHIDVAEVGDDSGWTYPSFDVTRVGDKLYGRGTADMKGGLAAALFALKALQACGVDVPGEIIFESVIGEEAGEAGTYDCIERGYRADLAIVPDTSNLRIEGQGGVITGWIVVKSPQTFHDGMRAKMIHAGGSVHGASAIEKMMVLLQGLQSLERHWAVTKSYPGFAPGSNTINPAVIEGGRHAAFVADECRLWVTVHFYPNESYEGVVEEIERHLHGVWMGDPWLRDHPPHYIWGGKSMIEERGEIFPALELQQEHPGIQLLATIHEKVTGEQASFGMSPTVTDAGWLGRAGMATALYGPGLLKNAHAVDEHCELQEIINIAKVLAQTILQWCNQKRDPA
ncbi:acetylornithine deacetylase [Tumebacillus avium]|uniref:Probable succinyl-diaminopimelate desuccinylase n=1 Tax=Tumebacillus avium TaxID=1903704 RepID=A0A1Y0IPM4_9BACL|nr:acetylornithine deacetylase [Tumebacillus avium]ARU61979.1 acetylornithine deacetylase [Tumebacillus avium]